MTSPPIIIISNNTNNNTITINALQCWKCWKCSINERWSGVEWSGQWELNPPFDLWLMYGWLALSPLKCTISTVLQSITHSLAHVWMTCTILQHCIILKNALLLFAKCEVNYTAQFGFWIIYGWLATFPSAEESNLLQCITHSLVDIYLYVYLYIHTCILHISRWLFSCRCAIPTLQFCQIHLYSFHCCPLILNVQATKCL